MGSILSFLYTNIDPNRQDKNYIPQSIDKGAEKGLTLYQTSSGFNDPEKKKILKRVLDKVAWCFLLPIREKVQFLTPIKIVYCRSQHLD